MSLGRNRGFDKEKALEEAMRVFWRNGYPGTSLSDLTSVMGINKSSLYAAFGNKEALFKQVIELYLIKHGKVHFTETSQADKPLEQRIRDYLMSISRMVTNPALPKGCLICLSTSEMAGDCLPEDSITIITEINYNTVRSLSLFFDREREAGNLNGEVSSDGLANYLITLQFGLAISARNGSSIQSQQEVVDFIVNQLKLQS